MENQKTIMLLVKDHPGVMQRITSLFTRRGFNMDSITVGATEEEGLSRINIVTSGDDNLMEQILNQLLKLIEVYKAKLINPERIVTRELALLKVNKETSWNSKLLEIIEGFKGTVVDNGSRTMIIQAVGESSTINKMVEQLIPYGLKELSRTGVMAMEKEF
ncbi:acetolactate synthase small subunit [Neobacillus sp. LXY-4]|uniref:acetolactate synthase small subunit n=1 Tax=Neobacillus sp. LXY-4 TaxID=3379826 RepID=UPI003EE24F30